MSIERLLLIAVVCASTLSCAQAGPLQPGQELSPAERSALTDGSTVQMESQHFHILTPAARPKSAGAANGETWLVNDQGVVGRSTHEVLVAQADSAAVQAVVASGVLPAVVQVSYSGPMRLTTLRFASFADAVRARTVLVQRLPSADVTVPVQYDAPRAR